MTADAVEPVPPPSPSVPDPADDAGRNGRPPADPSPTSPPATPPVAAPPAPPPAAPGDTEVLPRVLKAVSAVLAPTTVLTGLLFYFGRLHLTGMFRYLGVNLTVLDLTPADYLIRSADGLFVPLAGAAFTVMVLLWLHGVARRLLGPRRRSVRLLVPAVAAVALVLLGTAAAGLDGRPPLGLAPELPGLALAVGVLLLAYAVHLVRFLADTVPRRAGPAVLVEWGAVFVVVSVGLFWSVGSYAIGVGTGRGEQIGRELSTSPDAVLYSEKRLNLHDPGVVETDCQGDDAAYRFRYDGLKLVIQSGGQYLFLPAGWTRDDGPAIVIPRTDSLRLEFSAPGRAQVGSC